MLAAVGAFVVGAGLAIVLLDRLLRLSLTPEWVEASASVLSFLAAAVLAGFAGVQIWDARRHPRTVAGALLQEVLRIRGELGARGKDNEVPLVLTGITGGVPPDRSVVRLDAVPPKIHSWIEPVIPQIAEADAAIVGLFLKLDLALDNWSARVQMVRDAKRVDDDARATLDNLMSQTGAEGTNYVVAQDRARANVDEARIRLEAAKTVAGTMLRECHGTLDDLHRGLTKVTGSSA